MLCEHQRGRVQWVMSVDCHRSRICGWDRRVEGDFRSPLERNQTIVATFPSDSMRSTGVAADARWFENKNHRRPMKVCLTYAHDVANEAYTSKGELHYLLPPHKSYQRFLGLTISPTPSKYVQDCIVFGLTLFVPGATGTIAQGIYTPNWLIPATGPRESSTRCNICFSRKFHCLLTTTRAKKTPDSTWESPRSRRLGLIQATPRFEHWLVKFSPDMCALATLRATSVRPPKG